MDSSNIFAINGLAAKCKSKSEFYNLLTTEGGMYLPQDATQPYLRGFMMDKKCMLSLKILWS